MDIKKAKESLKGPIASVSTPFTKSGEIDFDSLHNIVEFIISAGSGTVLLTYGDSLYTLLTDDEIADITKRVIEQTRGRALTVTAGSWWLGKSIEFAKYSKDLGADMYMPLPPDWVNSGADENLVEFYSKISEVIPVMMVTMLGKRPVPMKVIETLLIGKNNVVAIKDDKCGEYGIEVAKTVNGRWAFLSGGRMKNHRDVLPYDVDGYLSVFMRFLPKLAHSYWDAIERNDLLAAKKMIEKYDIPFMEVLPSGLGLNFDALIHASMEIFEISKRWRRNPYMNATDEQMELLKAFFMQDKFKEFIT